MTDLLKLKKTDRVLEVGTGSGYQAAILAELADSVYTIEIIEGLGKKAAENLKRTVMTLCIPGSVMAITAGKQRRLLTELSLPPLRAIYLRR